MIQGAPPDAQRDPQGYYYWLVSNGFPHTVAYDEMVKEFGPPKTKEQQQKEAEKAQQQGQLAQVGGMVGGSALAGWAYNGFKMPEMFKGKAPTTTPTTNAPTATAPTATGANAGSPGFSSGAEMTGNGLYTPAPKVISSEGGMSTIELPTGGTQQVPTESLGDSSFWGNVNWGQVASGGLALAQMYGAYKSFKSGDKVGGGINMAAGAGNLAASGALGSSTAGAASSAGGGYLIPGLNIVAGAYGGYQTAQAMSDMAAGSQRTKTGVMGGAASGAAIGAGVGSIVPGVGTAIGAGVGAIIGATAGAVGSWTGSKKGKAQFMRDQIRGVLQQGNILDDKFQGTLANGTKYDFGKDGSTLKWKEIDKISSAQPKAWNGAVPLADALAASYGFVGQKASDIAAWYAKGAVSNAGDNAKIAQDNMRHFAAQQGITYDMVKAKLDEAKKDNRISQSQYDYYLGGARQLTTGIKQPPTQAGGAQTRPPAPLPQGAPTQMPEVQKKGKQSVGDVLRRNMNKG